MSFDKQCRECGFHISDSEYAKYDGRCIECHNESKAHPEAMPWEDAEYND